MLNKRMLLISLLCITNATALQAFSLCIIDVQKNNSKLSISLQCDLESGEVLLKDSLRFSTNSPKLILNSWKTKQEAIPQYISGIKSNAKHVFTTSFNATLELSRSATIDLERATLCTSCFIIRHQKATPYTTTLPIKLQKPLAS